MPIAAAPISSTAAAAAKYARRRGRPAGRAAGPGGLAGAAAAFAAGVRSMTRRTAVSSAGKAWSGAPPLASSHCDVLRKYSSPAGMGEVSMRSEMTGCRFELARSTSLRTCDEVAECSDKTSTTAVAASMARTMASP